MEGPSIRTIILRGLYWGAPCLGKLPFRLLGFRVQARLVALRGLELAIC